MITVKKLDLSVGARTLVTGLDWQVRAGECWSVIGPNGAGKSTLLRTVAGLRESDGGTVELLDKPLASWPIEELARQRALLPQGRSDAFAYSVIETVLTARHPYHNAHYWESDDDYRIATSALQALEVDHLAERDVRTLSGGERQRVAIACVIAQQTPLVLLDEPAAALDLAHQVAVMRLFHALAHREGKAVILISHDLNLAHAVSTHALLLMGDGRWEAGPAQDVMQASLLGACLGHPIEKVMHGNRTLFIPAEDPVHV
ncbi:MAG TPA: ABC transporter ATP-binding protein [Noviherbaspirillum sp.]|nr:ABC transporter ATP-binding protein [Noviherbaspirillum sp.]